MGIFRTNDPTQFDDIDGIIIDESAPPSSITGVSANVVIMAAQFQRGPAGLSGLVGSIGELQEAYGKSSYLGNLALKNKVFGLLKLIRVIASDSVKGLLTIDDGASTDIITFTAKYFGVYGNGIKITTEAATNAGIKYTIQDTNIDAVLPVEVYDDIEIASVDASTFAASQLVDALVLATSAEPDIIAATALATGSDGTIVDTDYEDAIVFAEQERAGNCLFLDDYNATRNGYLKAHSAATQNKMVIMAGLETDADTDAITDVVNYRDTDGRNIYAWPWVQTSIGGALVWQNPASWLASIFSQTSPHVSLAFAENTQFLAGVVDLKSKVSRAKHIALDAAGVCSFEQDLDIGFKVKNAVTTHIINSEKRPILRRRMADFLTDSIALFLKNYQNSVNSKDKRDEVKGQILDFDSRLIRDGVLPGEQDVSDGSPVLVDTDSLNTDSVVAQGMFKILYKRRIFSSMRYIVLQAEIGTGVVVTEA